MHVRVVTTKNYQMFDALVIDPYCGALDLDQSQCLCFFQDRQDNDMSSYRYRLHTPETGR